MQQHKYHYFYRIINLIDGKFYYGIHSTDNLDDKYMGSGRRLKEAMHMYGKENFKKEIIKFFDTREKASEYESLIVAEELVRDSNCYNVKCGGDYGLTVGTFLAKDKNGKFFRITEEDERYKSGELVCFMDGLLSVFDKTDEKYKIISKDTFKENRDNYITASDGIVVVKDKEGNVLRVSVDDERYLKGELVSIWKGRKHSDETKKKMSDTHKKNQHQKGEKNSQFGTCWLTKDGKDKKVSLREVDEYINDGWIKGRHVDENKIVRPTDSIPVEKVIGLYNAYHDWKEVASHLGINRGTLLRYRKRHNIYATDTGVTVAHPHGVGGFGE